MAEIVRPRVRWSNELALEHLAEQPAVVEKRLAKIEVPAKSDARFVLGPDVRTSMAEGLFQARDCPWVCLKSRRLAAIRRYDLTS